MTGNEFSDLRKRLGWTKRECGRRLGVDERTIWRWERRTAPSPPAANLMREWSGIARTALGETSQ